MRFSLKKFLGLLILIPFLLSGYAYAVAEEGETEGKKEEAAVEEAKPEAAPEPGEVKPEEPAPGTKEEAPGATGEKEGKGFYQEYVKPADYAISRAFMKISPLESPVVTQFRLLGSQIDYLTEAIPGLEIMGMIKNRTWVNTHGRSGYTSGGGDLHGDARGNINNKGRRVSQFNMIEWLGELEMRYSISPNFSLTSVLNYRYDSLYDWDKGHILGGTEKPYPDEIKRFGLRTAQAMGLVRRQLEKEVEKEQSYYRDTKQILRELYLDAIFPSSENGTVSFRLGKQQVGLGKQDFNVIDLISPRWSVESPYSDSPNLEWDRQPTWMTNVSYTFPERILPGVSMKFIWIPDFEPNYTNNRAGAPNFGRGRPLVREDLTNPHRVIRARNGVLLGPATLTAADRARGVQPVGVTTSPPIDDPTDWSFGGSEWAFNVEFAGPMHGTQWIPVLGEGWQTGLWWLSDFEGGFTNFRRGVRQGRGCTATPTSPCVARPNELKFTRKEHFMWGTDKNFYWAGRYWLFKWEQNFVFGVPVADARENTTAASLATVYPGLTAAQRGIIARRNLRFNDGFKKSNRMDTGVTVTTKFLTDLGVNILYIDQRWLNRPLRSGTRRLNANVLLWSLSYPLEGTEDRLTPSITTYVNLVGPASWRQQYVLGYDLGENTKLSFEYMWLSGDSDTGYGGWDDWDLFRFKVTHKF
ncbi:MAG: hypothetical protein HYS70_06865 [Nitrospinae bacterium]|nr:hypothetical protein [Nitrospinota bacterium]